MEIAGCETNWILEETHYGILVASLNLKIKNWMSENGPMDYTHLINLVWNYEDVDCCVFKSDNQKINAQISKKNDEFQIVIKMNGKEILNRSTPYQAGKEAS